jgi:hypothetical protein
MSGVVLAASTGDEKVDALLREVINRVEQTLPTQIRGYYVVGSHADGSALPLSDIDLDIVVKGGLDDDAIQDVETVALDIVNGYAMSHAVDLGAFLMHEARMQGHYALRKRDVPDSYRQYVGDEWAPFLDTLYARCRDEWRYQLPERAGDRKILRDLCEWFLAFENHFLSAYKDFVLSNLQGDDELAVHQTLGALQRLLYKDEDIRIALQDIRVHGTLEARQAAADTLAYYDDNVLKP